MRGAMLGASAMLISAHAAAQTTAQGQNGQQLEEIVVTATKTGATKLQQTPIAITSFTPAQLDSEKIEDVRGLVDYTPGLQISDINGYSQLYIRGVGSNTVFIGSDPSTTIHLDGVYLARPLSYFADFLDAQVDVLRGPQGTLYGRNSVGGTINITSPKPSDVLTGEVVASVGDYNEYSVKGYVSGPIPGTPILASLSAVRLSHDPYFQNVSIGGDIGNQDSWALRGQIYLPVGDQFDATVRADYYSADEASAGDSKLLQPIGVPLDDSILGDYHKIAANSPNGLRLENFGFALDMKYAFSDAVSLKSLTSYRSLFSSDVTDSDASSTATTLAIFDLGEHQLSEEVNLNAEIGPLTLVAGAYYFHENDREPADVILPDFGLTHFQRPTLEDESYAVFAQGDYHLTDQLTATVGLRWTHETKDYAITDFWTFSGSTNPAIGILAPKLYGIPGFTDPFQAAASKGAQALTPKFGLNYQMTEDLLLYASITRGFKSGGFDFGSSGPIQQSTGYGPEFLWSYEIGLKSQWYQNRLRVNLDAFYYDYSDLQVELFTPPASAFTQNAAAASIKGLEAELAGRPLPGLDLHASIAYLDAQYDTYPNAQFKASPIPFDASGKYLNDAPKWTFAVGGSYTYELDDAGSIVTGLDYHFQTTEFFSPANDGVNGISGYPGKQGSFGLLNARIGWDSEDRLWDASMIARNLTDRQYITGAADYGGPGLSTLVGRPGNPRTFVFQVARKF